MKRGLFVIFVLSMFLLSSCGKSASESQAQLKKNAEAELTDKGMGTVREFTMTARQWEFEPSTITVNKGDKVKLFIRSVDVTHGFGLPAFGIDERLEAGETTNVEFTADKSGTFRFSCTVFCGSGHSAMNGMLIVN